MPDDPFEIQYVEAGSLWEGTDPTYGENTWQPVVECGRCGALISRWREDDHTAWHLRNARSED
jgi:hypothetical protein